MWDPQGGREGGREVAGRRGELWHGCHSLQGPRRPGAGPVPLRKVGEGLPVEGRETCWWGQLGERGGRRCAPPLVWPQPAPSPVGEGLEVSRF